MNGDGYNSTKHFVRLEKIKFHSANQLQFNNQLKEINKELLNMQQIPMVSDHWIESLPSLDRKNNFSIKDYNKFLKLKKEYNQILEKSEDNLRELRILAIDDILDKIKNILKEDEKNFTIKQ